MEERRSRVNRKRDERKSLGKERIKGVATLRNFLDLGRVLSYLKDLWTESNL